MKIYCITYGNEPYKHAAKLNIRTAKKYGKADYAIWYKPEDIDEGFYSENKYILSQKKGNGFWLWKPYFIYTTLLKMQEGDLLIYTDAGIYYMEDLHIFADVMNRDKVDKMFFQMEQERNDALYSKKDAWVLIGADYEKDAFTSQALGGIVVVRNTSESRSFIKMWLDYCCNPQILMDDKSTLGEEGKDFILHRHDQSILSLLLKKEKIEKYRDPSQWSYNYYNEIPENIKKKSTYPQMMNVHRIPKAWCMAYVKFRQTDFMMKVDYKYYLYKQKKKGMK